jgi:hypothetical protein
LSAETAARSHNPDEHIAVALHQAAKDIIDALPLEDAEHPDIRHQLRQLESRQIRLLRVGMKKPVPATARLRRLLTGMGFDIAPPNEKRVVGSFANALSPSDARFMDAFVEKRQKPPTAAQKRDALGELIERVIGERNEVLASSRLEPRWYETVRSNVFANVSVHLLTHIPNYERAYRKPRTGR